MSGINYLFLHNRDVWIHFYLTSRIIALLLLVRFLQSRISDIILHFFSKRSLLRMLSYRLGTLKNSLLFIPLNWLVRLIKQQTLALLSTLFHSLLSPLFKLFIKAELIYLSRGYKFVGWNLSCLLLSCTLFRFHRI